MSISAIIKDFLHKNNPAVRDGRIGNRHRLFEITVSNSIYYKLSAKITFRKWIR